MSVAAALATLTAVLLARPVPVRRPSSLPAWAAVPGGLVLLGWAGAPPGPALVVATAAGGAALVRRQLARRRAAEEGAARVRGFCEELAGGLAAGLPVDAALAASVARWPELEELATTHRLGGTVPEVLHRLSTRPGADDLRLVAAAWSVAHRSGASLATALAEVADTVRGRQRTRRVVGSELASARATARLMAALPAFTLGLGSGTGDPVGFLLGTTPGLVCLAAGLLLGLLGLAWIEAIAWSVETGW